MNKPQGLGISKSILLNPGPNYYLEPSDQCFYISLAKEENFNWKDIRSKSNKSKKLELKWFFYINDFNYTSDILDDFCQNLFLPGPELSLRKLVSENNSQKDYNVIF